MDDRPLLSQYRRRQPGGTGKGCLPGQTPFDLHASDRANQQALFSLPATMLSRHWGDRCTSVRMSAPKCSRASRAKRSLSCCRDERLRFSFGTKVVRSSPAIRQYRTFRAIVSSEPISDDQSSSFAASTAGSAPPAARTSCRHRSSPSASPTTGWSNGIEALCSFSGL